MIEPAVIITCFVSGAILAVWAMVAVGQYFEDLCK